MKELLIVGAGPVGLYAAFTAGLRKIDSIVIESAQTVGGQLNLYLEKKIYDIPGFDGIQTKDLLSKLYNQYETYKNDVPLHLNETVIKISQKDDYFVVETNKTSYETKKILMTHGGGRFTPRKVEGVEAHNLAYNVNKLEDYRNKNVIIFGGGDSAVDWANLILDIAKNVYLVHRRNEFRAHLSSIEMFKEKGGQIYTPYNLIGQSIENKCIKEVSIENIETKEVVSFDVDEVLAFYGLIQTKSTYEDWLVHAENGLIKVDSKMATNIEGIYACGNGIDYEGKQKMITSGFGEVITAIGAINFELHPEQRVPQYSSLMKK